MKKLICVLILICCVLSSCNDKPIKVPSEKELSSAADMQLQEIDIDLDCAKLIDTTALYFTGTLGIRKTYPNSLPVITGFQYPYVYYERMTSSVKGSSENDPIRIYIGKYSLITHEKQEIARGRFTSLAQITGTVHVDENRVIYIFFGPGNDGMKTTIELFDFRDSSRKVIAEFSLHNFFAWTSRLSEEEFVFLIYESVPTGLQQVVLLYNINTEDIKEIYRGEDIGGYRQGETSTKDIFAIDTQDEVICLLMQQYVQDGFDHYMRKIDKYGNIISEEKIEALSIYDTLDNEAETLVVEGNYTVVHYLKAKRDLDNTNPISAVLYHTNEGYSLLDVSQQININVSCGIAKKKQDIAFFTVHNATDSLFALNVEMNEAYLIRINEPSATGQMRVDMDGNLLVEIRKNDKSCWYMIGADHLLGKLV